jgi:hypothetical protein
MVGERSGGRVLRCGCCGQGDWEALPLVVLWLAGPGGRSKKKLPPSGSKGRGRCWVLVLLCSCSLLQPAAQREDAPLI